MLRPALCLLCCEALGGAPEGALPAAVAIELLHNFTLIHDDIEDRSDTRHGRPTLWRVAGIEQAINAGDGLFALAQRTLLRLSDSGVEPARVLHAMSILNDACIALCEGQSMDIQFESRAHVSPAEYEAMIGGKTAALLGAAAGIGALCGGAEPAAIETFTRLGLLLGLSFQVQDDVLGVWGDPDSTGKSSADDIRARKKSYPVAHAMSQLEGEQRAELEVLYASSDSGPTITARIVSLLEASGARAAAADVADAYRNDALAEVASLEIDPVRKQEIEALAAFFVKRSR
jgi:geranylgeranyl diphosphate synthase type I